MPGTGEWNQKRVNKYKPALLKIKVPQRGFCRAVYNMLNTCVFVLVFNLSLTTEIADIVISMLFQSLSLSHTHISLATVEDSSRPISTEKSL